MDLSSVLTMLSREEPLAVSEFMAELLVYLET